MFGSIFLRSKGTKVYKEIDNFYDIRQGVVDETDY